jgi:hypothetical protein
VFKTLEYALNLVFTSAFVTYCDIRSITSFYDQQIVAIKAPVDTVLEVPDPDEVAKSWN